MRINKAASVPLVTHDPFFSIWSSSDKLYESNTVHWSGSVQRIKGILNVDNKRYAFLGKDAKAQGIPQKYVDVTATSTQYVFENEKVILKCRFTSPILLNDMTLVSRPCTYIDFEIEKKDAKEVSLEFEVYSDVVAQTKDTIIGYAVKREDYQYMYMGRAMQEPLSGSGDKVAIDWGYAYVACKEEGAKLSYNKHREKLCLVMNLEHKKQAGIIFAYDDLLSINYFGMWKKAYWTEKYATILDAIAAAFEDKEETLKKAAEFDKEMEERALNIGGEDYAYLCNMSYRQSVTAHKLITDETGNIIFLSKENDSNGCIGTVDVSYPSVPLFLLYDVEYVKGMLRPIFRFAACDVWEYDFAPHDVGRYPYAWGQVYAFVGKRNEETNIWMTGKTSVFPPFYTYPKGTGVYDIKYQMPVEECGDMLIMTAVCCMMDGNPEFAKPYWSVLKTWKNYLVKYGADPGDQLCTDDFAGHLEHNTNLSVKAIVGIKAYAILAEMMGEVEEAKKYHQLATEMAADWELRAKADDHYMLAFGSPDSWSLKYNLVWDKVWNTHLFSDEVYEKELSYYIQKANEYGTPLDSRSTYTKSDWILWCASMAKEKEQAKKLIQPVAHYLENTVSRIPFGDWYFSDTGTYCQFIARSVQGGIYMPMYLNKVKKDGQYGSDGK